MQVAIAKWTVIGEHLAKTNSMPTASTIRLQIETALSHKVPSCLTPAAKMVRPVAPTGIESLDSLLHGGLPIGALTEMVGPECSGRTSTALSFVARLTQANKVCAWIDITDALDPVSASAIGVDLGRLLWVRCGVSPVQPCAPGAKFVLPETYLAAASAKKGLHGGGHGSHPRSEAKGLSTAVSGWLREDVIAPRCAEMLPRIRRAQADLLPSYQPLERGAVRPVFLKASTRIDQGIRSADLLLQAGGFSAIVLDMGSLAPEIVSRVPLATWHRYRLASERTQSSIIVLTQHHCAKSSAELLLRLYPATALCDETTVFTGTRSRVEVERQRFSQAQTNVVPMRKPPQSVNTTSWPCRTEWAGQR